VPNSLFGVRWDRTAINHVPLRYKHTKNSDEKVLGSLSLGKKLKENIREYVGLDLIIVTAIAEWWMDQENGNDPKEDMFELGSKLDDFGFSGVAVQDFTGMILGGAIDDEDWKEIAARLDEKRKRRVLDSAKAVARAGLVHDKEDDDASEWQLNAGDDDQPYLPATLTPKL